MAIIKRQKKEDKKVIEDNGVFFDSLEDGVGGFSEQEILETLATEKRILTRDDNQIVSLIKNGEQKELKKLANQIIGHSSIFYTTKFLFLGGGLMLALKMILENEINGIIQYGVMAGLDPSQNNVVMTLKNYGERVHESIFFMDNSILLQSLSGISLGLLVFVPLLYIAYLIACWNSEDLRKEHFHREIQRIAKKENRFVKLKDKEKWSDEVAQKTLALYLMNQKYKIEDIKNPIILDDIIKNLQRLTIYDCWKIKRSAKFVKKYSNNMFPELKKT